ncbi:unnamed protein product [Acidocella sp. C78]|nr:unnamed protein product [Acidocella sp. C78]
MSHRAMRRFAMLCNPVVLPAIRHRAPRHRRVPGRRGAAELAQRLRIDDNLCPRRTREHDRGRRARRKEKTLSHSARH